MWYGVLLILPGAFMVHRGIRIIREKRVVTYTLLFPNGYESTGLWAQLHGAFYVIGGVVITLLGILVLDKDAAETCARAIQTVT